MVDWPNGLGFEAAGWPKNDEVPAGLPKRDIVYEVEMKQQSGEGGEKGLRGSCRSEVGVRRQGKRKQRVSLDQNMLLYHLQLPDRSANTVSTLLK